MLLAGAAQDALNELRPQSRGSNRGRVIGAFLLRNARLYTSGVVRAS
jgi:hypothetical protein